jgi:hypothetical protein
MEGTEMTTNEKIADLLYQQTYSERMDMAKLLHSMIADWVADGNPFEALTKDDYAEWLEALADEFAAAE